MKSLFLSLLALLGLNPGTPTPPAPVITEPVSAPITQTLTAGERSDEIKSLQETLIKQGYLTVPKSSTLGYFDNQTKLALKRYQGANGIPATGEVGPLTRAKLNGSTGSPQATSGQVTPSTSSGQVTPKPVTPSPTSASTQPAPTNPIPTLSLATSKSSIKAGENIVLTWKSSNALSCAAAGSWGGNKETSGSLTLSPTTNSTYYLTCSGPSGHTTRVVLVSVTGATTPLPITPPPTPPAPAPLPSTSSNTKSINAGSKNCLTTGVCFDSRVLLIIDGVSGNFIDSGDGYYRDYDITRYYSSLVSQEADFLIVFKDWNAPVSRIPSSAYALVINRNDFGMGMYKRSDSASLYGSKGFLKTFIIMPNIATLSDQNVFKANIFSFAHEIGHHWLAYFDGALKISDPKRSSHYDSCLIFDGGEYADLEMEARNSWKKSGASAFTSPLPHNDPYANKFSTLSLYVMGLSPMSSVSPVEIIRPSDGSGNCMSSNNSTHYNVTGSTDVISIDDLVGVYGKRIPEYPDTQKKFTIQVALLAHKNSNLTQADADRFSGYLDEVEKYLPFAFSSKATFDFLRK